MKEYASDQSRILVADLSLMNRREIRNRIAFEIWTAVVLRIEKYKIGAAAFQILETICFILFRDGSFTRGQSNVRRFIYERSATNIRDCSLAYSFICKNQFGKIAGMWKDFEKYPLKEKKGKF